MPMTNVIILMEWCDDTSITPLKLGNSYLNRFGIDEDAAFEILGIYYLKKSSKQNLKTTISRKYKEEKEQFDSKIVNTAIQKAAENQSTGIQSFFIYAGYDYQYSTHVLKSLVLEGMRRYGLQSAMLTMICMWRSHLVTKEQMEDYYKGKKVNDIGWFKESVHDDLQSLFEKLKVGINQNEYIYSFTLPKLTPEEMKLIATKDLAYLQTYTVFGDGRNPDVSDQDMNLSESKSKFIYKLCLRDSYSLSLDTE